MIQDEPLISCICVTGRMNSPELARSIDCFRKQTFNKKEMIILYQTDGCPAEEFTTISKEGDIIYIAVNAAKKIALGRLRNLAIANSTGKYFCVWDDDDWYHPERLHVQYYALVKNHKSASVLMNILLYNQKEGKAYNSGPGPWANTLMCDRELFNNGTKFPELNKSEDLHFINRLFTLNCIYPVNRSSLYIYVYHQNNTWNEKHFNKLFSKGQRLSEEASTTIANILSLVNPANAQVHFLNYDLLLPEIDYFHHFLKNLQLKY